MNIDWAVVWKAVKEPLREIVLAIIPVIMTYLAPVTAPWAVALYLVLRFVDQVLHELWKKQSVDNPDTSMPNGVLPF